MRQTMPLNHASSSRAAPRPPASSATSHGDSDVSPPDLSRTWSLGSRTSTSNTRPSFAPLSSSAHHHSSAVSASSATSHGDSDVSPPDLSRSWSLGSRTSTSNARPSFSPLSSSTHRHSSAVSGEARGYCSTYVYSSSKNPGTSPSPRHPPHSPPPKAKPMSISSGNRFYADIIARQQKEHMMVRRHKALKNAPHATTRGNSSTRAPEYCASRCMHIPSTPSHTITHTASSEFAASFSQLDLLRIPSVCEAPLLNPS